VGGTWRDNRYPGIAVDISSFTYSFSFEQNPNWSRVFSPGTDLHNYTKRIAAKYGLYPYFRFNTTVVSAVFDKGTHLWSLELADGSFMSARHVISATGVLIETKEPLIPGLEKFKGIKNIKILPISVDYKNAARIKEYLQGKKIEEARVVCLGAGAAAIACMKILISCGIRSENIFMLDRKGVIHSGRDDLNQYKAMFANDTDKRTLDDAIDGADVFLGLSGPDLLTAEQLKKMAPKPIVFACSNPDPEISPEIALATRDDLIMATGRSDYPNQVNNVLGFPFIFRGALDVRATAINEEMKVAAVNAIRELAMEPVPQEICEAYGVENFEFGKEYIIPKPMDVRLLEVVPAAVARAAVDSGVARNPYPAHYPLKSMDDII